MSHLNSWAKNEILGLMYEFTAEEIKEICRELAEDMDGIRISGPKENLIDQLDSRRPTKSELVQAIEGAVDLDYYLEDESSDDDNFEDEDDSEDEEISDTDFTQALRGRNIDEEYERLKANYKRDLQFMCSWKADGLRRYQQEAYDEAVSLLGHRSQVIVQLPAGSGKTLLAHVIAYERYLTSGGNVLVATPTWEIALQHAMTICQKFTDGKSRVLRLGGGHTIMGEFTEYTGSVKGKVILTVADVAHRRKSLLQKDQCLKLVIIDEGHYGWKKKRINSVMTIASKARAHVLVLTATPPKNMENLPFAAKKTYLDLVPDPLVPCRIIRLATGETFTPEMRNWKLSPASLEEISSRHTRYQKIVLDSLGHLKGQVIYYAGSIQEAEGVLKEYERHGIVAVLVHSKWPKKNKVNALAIDEFRSGRATVLINVQMLTMGFDVPSVETIIVARPVESDTLFTQMVGRGARPCQNPKKKEFILIDVHDVILDPEVAKVFEHGHAFYTGVQAKGDGSFQSAKVSKPFRVKKYGYTPGFMSVLSSAQDINLGPVEGFPFRQGQGFGVEIELTWKGFSSDNDLVREVDFARFRDLAPKFLNELQKTLGLSSVADKFYEEHGEATDHSVWNVEWDGTCGLEIKSPALMGYVGFFRLAKALEAIRAVMEREEVIQNAKTGTHIHFGYHAAKATDVSRLLKLWCMMEAPVSNLLAPSRVHHYQNGIYDEAIPNPYCIPLTYALPKSLIETGTGLELIQSITEYSSKRLENSRYLALNVDNVLTDLGTIEFRSLHGTVDFRLIAAWISLCMLIIQRAPHLGSNSLTLPQFGAVPESGPASVSKLHKMLVSNEHLAQPKESTLVKYLLEERVPASTKNWIDRGLGNRKRSG